MKWHIIRSLIPHPRRWWAHGPDCHRSGGTKAGANEAGCQRFATQSEALAYALEQAGRK